MSARESVIPVFVPHLGCPNDCVFCNQRRISGHQEPATAQTVEKAVAEAAALPCNGEGRQLAFYGGSFTAIPVDEQTALLAAAKKHIDSGFLSSLRLSTRPDAIDAAVLRRLREYGVETIELGAQSLDDEVLRLSGRGHTAQDVIDASGLIRQAGFKLVLQMMTGLPGDSDDKCVETARKIKALSPDAVRIYPTVIVRDTALYDLWQTGRYAEHTVEDAVRVCAKIVPLFQAAGIKIIRLGLNPTDELSGGGAAGGAYHPALGELVKSRIMYHKAYELLSGVQAGSSVVLGVNKSCISQMTGQHRQNLSRLCADYALSQLSVRAAELKNGEIEIQDLKVNSRFEVNSSNSLDITQQLE